jgi:hypothetical protein
MPSAEHGHITQRQRLQRSPKHDNHLHATVCQHLEVRYSEARQSIVFSTLHEERGEKKNKL